MDQVFVINNGNESSYIFSRKSDKINNKPTYLNNETAKLIKPLVTYIVFVHNSWDCSVNTFNFGEAEKRECLRSELPELWCFRIRNVCIRVLIKSYGISKKYFNFEFSRKLLYFLTQTVTAEIVLTSLFLLFYHRR